MPRDKLSGVPGERATRRAEKGNQGRMLLNDLVFAKGAVVTTNILLSGVFSDNKVLPEIGTPKKELLPYQ